MIHNVWILHATSKNPTKPEHALVAKLELSIPTDVPIESILELAFEKSNSIDCNWTGNPEVSKLHVEKARSTTVGDILLTTDRKFVVEAFGFREITKNPSEKAQ